MTDKDKIIKRLRQLALPDPHDEREVVNASLFTEAANVIESSSKELEAAKQRIAEYQAHNVKVQNLMWDKDEEKEALEKRMAGYEAVSSICSGPCHRMIPAEELTKREAAARQQGFEEGKQAGRDELQKELSEQEPEAHMYPSDLEKFSQSETFATAFSVAVGNPDENSIPMIRQPNKPDKE